MAASQNHTLSRDRDVDFLNRHRLFYRRIVVCGYYNVCEPTGFGGIYAVRDYYPVYRADKRENGGMILPPLRNNRNADRNINFRHITDPFIE